MTRPAIAHPAHGGQLRDIAERFNIPSEHLTDFSANINPGGPSPAVLTALRTALDDTSTLALYPDLQHTALKQAIAQHLGLTSRHILIGNGFVPLLEAVLRSLPVRTCLLPVPAFVEYRSTLSRASIAIEPRALTTGSSFAYDPETLLAAPHDAILLANPQNPSGVCHSAAFMRSLIASAAQKNCCVLLDEAFIDYAPKHSLTTAIDEFPNLIVFRSVTKFHAIPGLRAAYAAAHPQLVSRIEASLPPWPVSTLASIAVIAALGDRESSAASLTGNAARRSALQQHLTALGLAVYPSAANFLLFRLPPGIDPHTFWEHMIAAHGIVLRSCANYEALAPGHFRAAVLTAQQNARLTAAMAASLSHFSK